MHDPVLLDWRSFVAKMETREALNCFVQQIIQDGHMSHRNEAI